MASDVDRSSQDLPAAHLHGTWEQGWWRHARQIASPNFGARPLGVNVDLIVVHAISLAPGQYGTDAVMQFFTNQLDWSSHPYFETLRGLKVSAHFFIRRDGEVWQFVSGDQRAWHAGVSHYRGRDNCNDDSIGIELEGLEGDDFDPPQYESLARLCKALAKRYPVAHVAGHEHIAPGRKGDPGRGFDWSRLQRLLAWPEDRFPDPGTGKKSADHRSETT